MRHWHKEPAQSTLDLIEGAPLGRTPKGIQLAVELIAYPEGKVQIAVSTIEGQRGRRKITQAGGLVFNDIDEAKDALDMLADRANAEAEALRQPVDTDENERISAFLQDELRRRGLHEVDAVEAATWLDAAHVLKDSRSRPGLPLRDRLRARAITGAEQRSPRPYGRWFIVRQ